MKITIEQFPAILHDLVKLAAQDAVRILSNKAFTDTLSCIREFDFSLSNYNRLVTGVELVDALNNALFTLPELKVVGVSRRFSKVLAWVNPGDPTIYLNTRKLPRAFTEVRGTIAHEFIHVADQLYTGVKFGHGGNANTVAKAKSAPYFVGLLASMWI